MLTVTEYEHEIVSLHEFFEEWFRGERSRDSFRRFERSLGDEFEQVTPNGSVVDREEIRRRVRDSYGQYDDEEFSIEISGVEPIAMPERRALVRYEEWQTTSDGTSGRLSTAWLASPDGDPEAIEWRHLQETWMNRSD